MVEIKINKERCKGCELCVSVCKKGVIKMSELGETNKMGYIFARTVNLRKCVACANCAVICPDVCIEIRQ